MLNNVNIQRILEEVASLFFFFKAEDGIRVLTVTGVQTCALPIYSSRARRMTAIEGSGGLTMAIVVTLNRLLLQSASSRAYVVFRPRYRRPATPATTSTEACQKTAGTRLLYANRLAPNSQPTTTVITMPPVPW